MNEYKGTLDEIVNVITRDNEEFAELGDALANSIEKAEKVSQSLMLINDVKNNVSDVIAADGTISSTMANLVAIESSYVAKTLGIRPTVPFIMSLESYGNTSSKWEATKTAFNNVKEVTGLALKKLKNVTLALVDSVRLLLSNFRGIFGKNKVKASTIYNALARIDNKTSIRDTVKITQASSYYLAGSVLADDVNPSDVVERLKGCKKDIELVRHLHLQFSSILDDAIHDLTRHGEEGVYLFESKKYSDKLMDVIEDCFESTSTRDGTGVIYSSKNSAHFSSWAPYTANTRNKFNVMRPSKLNNITKSAEVQAPSVEQVKRILSSVDELCRYAESDSFKDSKFDFSSLNRAEIFVKLNDSDERTAHRKYRLLDGIITPMSSLYTGLLTMTLRGVIEVTGSSLQYAAAAVRNFD